MSASKLIIHKYEANGINFKSLQVSNDDDNINYKTRYSEWLDGKIQEEKKNQDKSSRLIVKIASGNEIDRFNLEANAKELDIAEANLFLASKHPKYPKSPHELCNKTEYGIGKTENYNYDESKTVMINSATKLQNVSNFNTEFALQYYNPNKSNLDGDDLSPLEYSLEKVRQNNARIMENIHMLNRTLNYAKNKEILDIAYPKPMRSYPCNTCGKCFVYETGLRRHYSVQHALAAEQPRWQVVWTCIRCFQVWPRQDQALLLHSSECGESNNIDSVLEIKASSLLQCEYCEKVYTSIPRLLRHTKIHTTSNNYECNACKMAFSSYKIAEEHWVKCPWLKAHYSFSLPKLLLCNACDRKFKNYEQLYNHRYKVGHFMTKSYCNTYNTNSLGILVYQCEMCGAWYHSITSLKAHKNQCHPKHEHVMQCKMERNLNDQSDYTSFSVIL